MGVGDDVLKLKTCYIYCALNVRIVCYIEFNVTIT